MAWEQLALAAIGAGTRATPAQSGISPYASSFGMGQGDWTVNLSGSGAANQSASAGSVPAVSNMMTYGLIAAALGVAWYLLK